MPVGKQVSKARQGADGWKFTLGVEDLYGETEVGRGPDVANDNVHILGLQCIRCILNRLGCLCGSVRFLVKVRPKLEGDMLKKGKWVRPN